VDSDSSMEFSASRLLAHARRPSQKANRAEARWRWKAGARVWSIRFESPARQAAGAVKRAAAQVKTKTAPLDESSAV
jgi:hypothetical protein